MKQIFTIIFNNCEYLKNLNVCNFSINKYLIYLKKEYKLISISNNLFDRFRYTKLLKHENFNSK